MRPKLTLSYIMCLFSRVTSFLFPIAPLSLHDSLHWHTSFGWHPKYNTHKVIFFCLCKTHTCRLRVPLCNSCNELCCLRPPLTHKVSVISPPPTHPLPFHHLIPLLLSPPLPFGLSYACKSHVHHFILFHYIHLTLKLLEISVFTSQSSLNTSHSQTFHTLSLPYRLSF